MVYQMLKKAGGDLALSDVIYNLCGERSIREFFVGHMGRASPDRYYYKVNTHLPNMDKPIIGPLQL
jgi:hypothetical protein